MSRYDFRVVICYLHPQSGEVSQAVTQAFAAATSEVEARRILIHDILTQGGWIKSLQRIQTPIPPQAGDE